LIEPPPSASIPLRALPRGSWGPVRTREPITVGVPFPKGTLTSELQLSLHRSDATCPLQARALDRWPDGSIRWLLVDFQADADGESAGAPYSLSVNGASRAARAPAPACTTSVTGTPPHVVTVDTGAAVFEFRSGGAFPFSEVFADGAPLLNREISGLRIEHQGRAFRSAISRTTVVASGPLRVELDVHAVMCGGPPAPRLEVFARVELFAGSAAARVALTIRNPSRAAHPGGIWVLGDAGSILLQSASVTLKPETEILDVRCAAEPGAPLSAVQLPFEIYQESSGGERWDSRVHVDREGRVPLRFRGYRLRAGTGETTGCRAQPVVSVRTAAGSLAVAFPHFWQNFPRAITVAEGAVEVALFPRQAPGVHELQGGEQKTHVFVAAFADDRISEPPLAWCHGPQLFYPPPEWCCRSGAVPHLLPEAEDPNRDYVALVNLALDPARGFFAKREIADEYGWRHFGDLYADHESAFQPPDGPFVSHYNNQYDAIAGFAIHFLRTGERRWWELMDDLARHVCDVDLYHTSEDKAAYNGGLFWHTNHYMDAATSTHRTYPAGSGGGGPSAEHNYNAGLALHYLMTGEPMSRSGAIGLGRWVIDMDDGSSTPLRWVTRVPTGLASATGSSDYHGPGRGPANSIVACLTAHRLTGDAVYLAKAEELIRRCIHPAEDIAARNLFDVEKRWYYTVFLQALGDYVLYKADLAQYDRMYGYARAALLRYAAWMAENERPYLSRPDLLEYPTETWAAQDMRKADVLARAAGLAGDGMATRFEDRARFFFESAVSELASKAGRAFTRPLALVLTAGVRGWARRPASAMPLHEGAFPEPAAFVPQKTLARRRLCRAGVLATIAFGLAAGWWLLRAVG
jgi:hypothetical protein